MPKLSNRERLLIFSFLCAAWASMFAMSFVMQEDPVYTWDNARSHNMTIKLLESDSPLVFLNYVRKSLSAAYNAVGDLLPAFWELITGSNSRATFIMSLIIFYLAPLGFLLPHYGWKFFGGPKDLPPMLGFSLILWTFLYIPFWPSLLLGYTDLAALIPLGLATALALDTDITDGHKKKRMIWLGLNLYLCFLLRRWFIFVLGSFFLTYFIVSLGHLLTRQLNTATKRPSNKMFLFHKNIDKLINLLAGTINRSELKNSLKFMIYNLLTAGLVSFILIAIFQFPVLRGMIFNKYSELYAAFQMPFRDSMDMIYTTTGPVVIALAAVSPLAALIRRQHIQANMFALLCPVIYILAFTRVQGLNMHHTLAITFYIWLLAFGGLISLYQALSQMYLKAGLCLTMTIFMIVGFVSAFDPPPAPGGKWAMFPNIRIQPLSHPNYSGFKRLIAELEDLIGESSAKVAILAATPDLNHDLVRNSLKGIRKNNILPSKDVDQRDGISVYQLVAAEYVVINDPPDQGQGGGAQFVITVPAGKVLTGEGIGKAYKLISGGYPLGNNNTAHIYKKTRPFTPEEVTDYFSSFPPGAENWLRPVTEYDKLFMTAQDVISDGKERLPFDREKKPGQFVIKPGANPPTSVTLNLEQLEQLRLEFRLAPKKLRCSGRATVSVGHPGLNPETFELRVGETKEIDLDLTSSSQVTISATRDSGTSCDFVYFKVLP